MRIAFVFSDVHGRDATECVGLVKFIGFINNNHKDVYIGLRMEDEGIAI